jgi:DNA-binding beta-propeller fold protein YncE
VATDDAGDVYVSDITNNRIQKFTGSGTYLTQWGSFGAGEGQFSSPYCVATDDAGDVYVADYSNSRVQKFGPLPTPTKSASWGQLKYLYR